MTKRLHKSAIITLIMLLLCALSMLCAFGFTNVNSARAESTPTAKADEVIVLDKIEDFRTEDNGDGTYTICGNDEPTVVEIRNGNYRDFECIYSEGNSRGLSPKKTAFSAVGMRKILGLPEGDNVGLSKESDETDDDFDERVYQALYTKLKSGDVMGLPLRVVIPTSVSEIQSNAFVVYGNFDRYTGDLGKYGYIGGNTSLDAVLNGQFGFYFRDDDGVPYTDVDYNKTYEENYNNLVQAVIERFGGDDDLSDEDLEFYRQTASEIIQISCGNSASVPQIVDLEFAKTGDDTRSLSKMGARVFGTIIVNQPFIVPANVNVTAGSDDVSSFGDIRCEELIFEEGVITIPENFATDKTSSFEDTRLKKLTIPQSVKNVNSGAFNKCANLTDFTVLSEGAIYADGAFKENVNGDRVTVRVESIKQWFSNAFQLNKRSFFNLSSSPFAKNTGNMFIPKTDVTDPDDFKDNEDFLVDGDIVWERVKHVVITEDILPSDDDGKYIPACILRGCELLSVDINCDINRIGAFAFYGCSSLNEVHFKNVTIIDDGAFANTGLRSVEFPASLKTITTGDGSSVTGAFEACEELRSITFAPNSQLEQIGAHSFYKCFKLGRAEDGKDIPLVIPSSVTTIGYIAFGYVWGSQDGNTNCISEVYFEDDGNKNRDLKIDTSFYGCMNLQKVTLPDCKISMPNAFYYCYKLSSLYLPAGATILGQFIACGEEVGGFTLYVNGNVERVGLSTGTFALHNNQDRITPVTIVGSNYAVMSNFKTVLESADKATVQDNYTLTYTYNVTVKYAYTNNGEQLEVNAPSVYVFGDESADVTFPAISDEWYLDADLTTPITVEKLAAYIKSGNTDIFAANTDEILLYMDRPAALVFRGANNLVYNGLSYAFDTELNALLHTTSAQINDDMSVTLESYTDTSGVVADVLPQAVLAAGAYSFAVTYQWLGQSTTSYFDIVIGKQKVDISALDWRVTSVEGESFERPIALQSARLYIYDKGDGELYASLTRLNTELSEFAGYTLVNTIDAGSSIARYRGVALTVGLGANANPNMYDIRYGNNQYTNCGVYDAVATLTPNNNYELAVGDTSDFAYNGLSVVANDDGSYTVTKRWYVVQISNWLVTDINATESNHELYEFDGNTEFGVAPTFEIPYAVFGDVDNVVYLGTNSDLMTFTLVYNYNIVIGEFNRKTYGDYMNAAMPAGRYELTVNMESVYHNGEYIPAFSRTFVFTVSAKELPATAFAAFTNAINGKTFSFDYDNSLHLMSADAVSAVNALKAAIEAAQPDRTGTIWADSKYDTYYGNFEIKFNLDRMGTATYFTENDLNGESIKPVDPNKYSVYYLVSASNFAPLVSDTLSTSAYDAARREFVFYTVIVREIAIPTANSVLYSGEAQKADIASSEFYTVNAYDGFTDKGKHTVTLTLVNSEYYRWAGKTLGEATATVSFEIMMAGNEWIEAPDVVRWIEGKYNEEENTFIGAAKFGTITYIITDTNDNVLYDAAQGINKLAGAKAGTYILKATVVGTDNYNGLSEAFTIRILEKVGMPWWATLCITLGALLIAALIIFILWKKGVFQILTEKIVVAIRTKASVDATIASVRAAKMMEAGKQSVAEAKRRERIEELQRKAKEQRSLPPEERAAQLEAKAQADAEKAAQLMARSEASKARAAKMRGNTTEEQEVAEEVTATETPETPTEE